MATTAVIYFLLNTGWTPVRKRFCNIRSEFVDVVKWNENARECWQFFVMVAHIKHILDKRWYANNSFCLTMHLLFSKITTWLKRLKSNFSPSQFTQYLSVFMWKMSFQIRALKLQLDGYNSPLPTIISFHSWDENQSGVGTYSNYQQFQMVSLHPAFRNVIWASIIVTTVVETLYWSCCWIKVNAC